MGRETDTGQHYQGFGAKAISVVPFSQPGPIEKKRQNIV